MPSTSPLDETELTEALLITKEFETNAEFSVHIEAEAKTRNITIFEMLMEYCTESDIEPIAVAGLITKDLKEKIEAEMQSLNLLKPRKVK
jgi:D-hexose-6-phosphate mutarotase